MTTVFPSAAYTATTNKNFSTYSSRGGILTLDITAVTGTTPSMTVKLQHRDQLSGQYVDIPGAAFAAKTTTGTSTLVVYPGATVAANASISTIFGDEVRAVATISGTTPSFTFTLSFDEVK